MEATPPLVGRDNEIETILGHLGQAYSSNGGLLLISGEAGMGKTRLVQYLIEKAEDAGFLSLVGRCLPGTPSPYLPYREVVGKLERSVSANGTFASSSSSEVLFNTLDLLSEQAQRTPLLVCIEDMHWADSLTVQLSHFLARNIKDQRILIVGTYRPEDLTSDIEDTEHPLKNSIRNMLREEIMSPISLAPISKDHLVEAMEGMLGSKVDPDLARRISHDSEGNPLFIVETLRSLKLSEALFQDGGQWNIRKDKEIEIPSTIRDIVMQRFSKLNKQQRRIIENASVIGEYFIPDHLNELVESNILKLVEELDMISRMTYLIVEEEEKYHFAHDKVRTVIYDNISKSRRLQTHLHYANILESKHLDETNYSALSWHFYQAAEAEKCAHYSYLAGKIFLYDKSPQDAVTLLRRCQERIPNDDGHYEMRLDLLESLGDSYQLIGNMQDSWNCYEELLDSCTDRKMMARVYRKSSEVWSPNALGKGDATRAFFLLERAESIGDPDVEEMAFIEFRRAELLFWAFRSNESYELSKRATKTFDSIGNEVMVVELMFLQMTVMTDLLLIKEGLVLAESILPRAYEIGDKKMIVGAESCLGMILNYIGRSKEAIPHNSKQIEIASKLGLFFDECSGLADRSLSWYEIGEFKAALEDGIKSEKIAIRINAEYDTFRASWRIAYASLELNDLYGAERCLVEMNRIKKGFSGPLHVYMEGVVEGIMARLLVKQDDHVGSFIAFERSIEKLVEAGGVDLLVAKNRFVYAQALILQSKFHQAESQLLKANEVFIKIQNDTWMNKIRELRKTLNIVR